MLTIVSYGEGKCVWCCKTSEGVQAKFQDGLSGFFCKKHLWEAIEARGAKEEKGAAPSSGSGKAA